jgi:hypothetical protein
MATATSLGTRDEFVNTTSGWVGAVQIGPHGQQKGIAVEPGGSVWLTEDEQILTANAPRRDEDNPFLPRQARENDEPGARMVDLPPILELRTRGMEVKNRRPFGADAVQDVPRPVEAPLEEDTGAAPLPEGEPAEGERAAGEEVATPDVVPEGRARRRRS